MHACSQSCSLLTTQSQSRLQCTVTVGLTNPAWIIPEHARKVLVWAGKGTGGFEHLNQVFFGVDRTRDIKQVKKLRCDGAAGCAPAD